MVEIGVGFCLCLCSVEFWYFLSREKKCVFFPFWSNECVLNCNLDVYAWFVRKCWKIRDFKNFECWILLYLRLGKT